MTVKEGKLQFSTSEKGKKASHHVVLFNDAFLLLKKSKTPGKKYRYENLIHLEEVYRASKCTDDGFVICDL